MAQCPTCGSEIADNADVCPDCGMDLQSMPPQDSSTPAAAPAFSAADNSAPDSSEPIIEADIVSAPDAGVPDTAAPATDDADLGLTAPPDLNEPTSPVPAATAPLTATANLTVKRGGLLTTEKFVFGANTVIGRFDPSSGPVDVDMAPLPEANYVSRHHAQIRCDESGQWYIRDLGSRNGTFVRSDDTGQFLRITDEHPLHEGDEVALGNARFEFHLGA
jgi:pSer/pThr/pTyr-binding forkhead associated (FHA) protein